MFLPISNSLACLVGSPIVPWKSLLLLQGRGGRTDENGMITTGGGGRILRPGQLRFRCATAKSHGDSPNCAEGGRWGGVKYSTYCILLLLLCCGYVAPSLPPNRALASFSRERRGRENQIRTVVNEGGVTSAFGKRRSRKVIFPPDFLTALFEEEGGGFAWLCLYPTRGKGGGEGEEAIFLC